MKKIYILTLLAVFFSMAVTAQNTEKEQKKEITDKAVKSARQEAKKLSKEGWKTMPGSIPMDKLLENSWMKQVATDENGQPNYIMADGNGVAESKSVAEAQAIEFAKLQLAGTIESNIASIVKGNLANSQESTTEATSVTEIIQSSKNIIAQQMGYINPAFKLYRDLKDKKVEVQVRIFYETKQSLIVAKKAIRKELKEKLQKTDEQVDKLLMDNPK
ncbi:MAG TPA: hypothetical protein PKN12_09455 [Bacteroidales bacterium]|nr:hypothetical protein [Bacteroidales bacterium]HPT10313.1 hypothetical protein [Bacteroidales bacterium]